MQLSAGLIWIGEEQIFRLFVSGGQFCDGLGFVCSGGGWVSGWQSLTAPITIK